MSTQKQTQGQKHHDLFHLDTWILDALNRSMNTGPSVMDGDEVQDAEPRRTAAPKSAATTMSCVAICNIHSFPSLHEMRMHYTSDWHRYNVKRNQRGMSSVSEDVFETLSDVSSIDASSDEESDAGSDAADAKDVTDGIDKLSIKGSPYIKLSMQAAGATTAKHLMVYKQALASKSTPQDQSALASFWITRILSLQSRRPNPVTINNVPISEPIWTLIMVGSGHFAGVVIGCHSRNMLAHKTMHRYTTRRKQGGAQSSNDASKGNAKSAGAGLRRYNEAALNQDIRDVMKLWVPYLRASDAVFVRLGGGSGLRDAVFGDSNVLSANDDKIRTIPFTTRRPTLKELMRCFDELCVTKIVESDIAESAPAKPFDAESAENPASSANAAIIQPEKHVHAEENPEDNMPPPPSDKLIKLMDFCRRGKHDLLKSHLDPAKLFPNSSESSDTLRDKVTEIINTALRDADGISLLHIASSQGHHEIVRLLLHLGADPTRRGQARSARPYDLAQNKDVRDTFRRFMAASPDKWDYADAHVPGPLTAEMEERQHAKEMEMEKKRKEIEERKRSKAAARSKSSESLDELDSVNAGGSSSKVIQDAMKASKSGASSSTKPSGKRLGSAKLSKQQLESVGITPEQRARLDREKRALAAEARLRGQQNKCGACGKSLTGMSVFEKQVYRYCSMECLQKHRILF